jgi:CheY-like chemotaxis protein
VLLKDESQKNHQKIETFVTGFLSAAAMLSIDIQMAKYLEEKTEPKKPTEKEEEKKTESDSGKSAREKIILAVDDASISLSMLKKMLLSEPYKLVCVNSGEDALRFLETHQSDLFILDIEMPKMNGYELAGRIRASGQKAPIIYLTGNATRRYVMSAIKAGASDFIVKPVDKKYLTCKIKKHI